MSDVVPILRVADAEASVGWYARPGFEVEWRHQFEPGFPLFVSIRRDRWSLFLFRASLRPGTYPVP